MNAEPYYFIGLMSGTSLDAVDAALVDFGTGTPELIHQYQHPLSPSLKSDIQDLCSPGENEIERMGRCDAAIGHLFAGAALTLIREAKLQPDQIAAIGSHGQTIRHHPDKPTPFTLQIGDPNLIAQLSGITTVADFRRRDMAAGGQGAPLVPAFHKEVFSSRKNRALLNIGGMANLTLLPSDKSLPITGFDTGPGNVLLDAWYRMHQPDNFDNRGEWAAGGKIQDKLLNQLIADDYFALAPPKSTGRELFNLAWLKNHLATLPQNTDAQWIGSTLTELTAVSVSNAIKDHFPQCEELFVCGGGAHNDYLLCRLQQHMASCQIQTTAKLGIDPDWVEAMAFAWLAKQTLTHQPGNIVSVTGASEECILGGVYYA